MSEDQNVEPVETEDEDIEVVAHTGEEEAVEAGCVINNSSEL